MGFRSRTIADYVTKLRNIAEIWDDVIAYLDSAATGVVGPEFATPEDAADRALVVRSRAGKVVTVRPTGGDDGARLQAIVTQLSGGAAFSTAAGADEGCEVALGPGTFVFATPVRFGAMAAPGDGTVFPQRIIVSAHPNTIIQSNLAQVDGYSSCPFVGSGVGQSSLALHDDVVVGSREVYVSATTGLAVGGMILLSDKTAVFNLGIQYTVLSIGANIGGRYLITVDRPIMFPFTSTYSWASRYYPVQGVQLIGNGALIIGSGDRAIEFAGAKDFVCDGWRVQSLAGTSAGFTYGIGCDVYGLNPRVTDCSVDGAAYTSHLYMLESNSNGHFEVSGRNGANGGAGVFAYQNFASTFIPSIDNCDRGVWLDYGGSAPFSSVACVIDGGYVSGCQIGVNITDSASGWTLRGNTLRDNALAAIRIESPNYGGPANAGTIAEPRDNRIENVLIKLSVANSLGIDYLRCKRTIVDGFRVFDETTSGTTAIFQSGHLAVSNVASSIEIGNGTVRISDAAGGAAHYVVLQDLNGSDVSLFGRIKVDGDAAALANSVGVFQSMGGGGGAVNTTRCGVDVDLSLISAPVAVTGGTLSIQTPKQVQIRVVGAATSLPEQVAGLLSGKGTIVGAYFVPDAASAPAGGANNHALALWIYDAGGGPYALGSATLDNAHPMTAFASFAMAVVAGGHSRFSDGARLTFHTTVTGTATMPSGTLVVQYI